MAGSHLSDSSSSSTPARTLAIIKTHASKDRFEIESRLTASGFEIIKERQMAFHEEDNGVRELFGDAALSLCGEPVWVYVLERRRAIEVLKSLMGDEDPELARINAPDSIRAVYGQSVLDNAIYGSPDAAMAELQINSIFMSSPPLPSTEPTEDVPEQHLEEYHSHHSEAHYSEPPASSVASSNTNKSVRVDVASKAQGFKARPIPASVSTPSIQPRSTRAAALRAGAEIVRPKRVVATRESIAKTFENVPGHKRAIAIQVASTAPPVVAPKQTRASVLRVGRAEPPKKSGPPKQSQARAPTSSERLAEIFANVPGHKRRQTIAVASTAPPSIAPRMTKAAVLRTGQPGASPSRPKTAPSPKQAPESPTRERPLIRQRVSFDGVPGHKRSETIEVPSTRPPSTTPRINRSAALRLAHKETGGKAPPSAFSMKSFPGSDGPSTPSRSASQASFHAGPSSERKTSTRAASVEPGQTSGARAPSRTTAAPPRPPSITPRLNRSAMLRASMGGPAPPSARKVFAF